VVQQDREGSLGEFIVKRTIDELFEYEKRSNCNIDDQKNNVQYLQPELQEVMGARSSQAVEVLRPSVWSVLERVHPVLKGDSVAKHSQFVSETKGLETIYYAF